MAKWSGGKLGKDYIHYYVTHPLYGVFPQRYTHDMTDVSGNLGFQGYWATDFPSPYFDSDDDDRDGYREETEITVESRYFPTVDLSYFMAVKFKPKWVNPHLGHLHHTPAISHDNQIHYDGDKWNTTSGLYSRYPYIQHYGTGGALLRMLPAEVDVFKDWKDSIVNRDHTIRVKLPEPISVDELISRDAIANERKVVSYALEYEAETSEGLRVITVGGDAIGNEIVSFDDINEFLGTFPESYKFTRLLGVASYELGPVNGKTETSETPETSEK